MKGCKYAVICARFVKGELNLSIVKLFVAGDWFTAQKAAEAHAEKLRSEFPDRVYSVDFITNTETEEL